MRPSLRRILSVFVAVLVVVGATGAVVELGGPGVSVVGGARAAPYQSSDLTYDSTTGIPGVSAPTDVGWNPDGTKMYVTDLNNGDITEFDVSETFNASTATELRNASVGSSPEGFSWEKNGTKLFIARGNAGQIREYTASDPYNVSSISFVQAVSVTSPRGVDLSNDGSKIFYPSSTNDDLRERALSTPYDLSTMSGSVDASISLASNANPRDIVFSSDGTEVYTVENEYDRIRQYSLSTAFDLSTSSSGGAHDVSGQETIPSGLAWNDQGTKAYLTGQSGKVIDIYVTFSATVSGYVKDGGGNPVSGATVTTNQSSVTDETSGDGSYSLQLDDATHEITASKSGYGDNSTTITVSGSDITGENITIMAKSSISGMVVDSDGNAIEGATVELWQINDAQTTKDAGETVEEAQKETIETLTRAVPRDRFNPDLDPVNDNRFTGSGAGRMVLVHEEGAWFESSNVKVLGSEIPVYSRVTQELDRPLIQLEPDTVYTFSIWDRSKEPAFEDAVDNKIDPGVSHRGTIVVEQIGPGNSTVRKIELETEDRVQFGFWPLKVGKKHEYATASLPTGYYVLHPKQGGTPVPVRVGNPEEIPRHFNIDLRDADDKLAEIASDTRSRISAGELSRATVETNASGYFSRDVPAGYSTVAITVFDGQGLTDGITDPTLEDLRTQIQQQDYNGSIYLSTSPTVVHPPKSGIEITVVEIKRPSFADLQAYLDLLGWLEELVDEEAFARLSTLWTDPVEDVPTEDLRDRAKKLDELIQQNGELEDRLEEIRDENEGLSKELDRIRKLLEDGQLSRDDTKEYLEDLTEAVQTSQPDITVNVGEPELEVPESDTEPTLLNLRLPVESRAGQDSSLTTDGVAVLVHYDNGTSTTMPESYWSIDNAPGASQGTGSEIVISDYPIPADVAVASIEILVELLEGSDPNIPNAPRSELR